MKNIIIYGKQGTGKSALVKLLTEKYHPSEILSFEQRYSLKIGALLSKFIKIIVIEDADPEYIASLYKGSIFQDWIQVQHIFTFQGTPVLPKYLLDQCQVIETINC